MQIFYLRENIEDSLNFTFSQYIFTAITTPISAPMTACAIMLPLPGSMYAYASEITNPCIASDIIPKGKLRMPNVSLMPLNANKITELWNINLTWSIL